MANPQFWRRKAFAKKWNKKHLINRDGNICWICKKPFESMKDATLDHIFPRSKGGLDTIDNLKLAHLKCNNARGSMTMDEFLELQAL